MAFEVKTRSKTGGGIGRIIGIIVAFVLAILVVLMLIGFFHDNTTRAEASTGESTGESVLSEGLNTCRLHENLVGHADNRLVDNMKDRIQLEKDTGKPFDQAYRSVMETVMSQNEFVLRVVAVDHMGILEQGTPAEDLREGNCLSPLGLSTLETAMTKLNSATITEVQCNAKWWNSGFDSSTGTYGAGNENGIKGDLDCVKVTFPDGSYYVALLRCHNFVYDRVPSFMPEPVKTDNERPEYNTPTGNGGGGECEYDCGGTPEYDKNSSYDPYNQGNAPTGGGQNADSGPRELVPQEQMQQPAETVELQPAEPEPIPVENTEQPLVVTDEPAPTQETGTPTTTEPESQCSTAAPGGATC